MQKITKGKYIRSIQELPQWFKLESYDITDGWSADLWKAELQAREIRANLYQATICSYKSIPEKFLTKEHKTAIADLESASRAKKCELIALISQNPSLAERINADHEAAIKSLCGDAEPQTVLQQMRQQREIDRSQDKRVRRSVPFIGTRLVNALSFGDIFSVPDEVQPDPDNFDDWFVKFDDVIPNGTKFHFSIDLNATDEAILKEFKRNLIAYRTELNIQEPKKPTETIFSKLSQYRVLPYIDLWIWAESIGCKIKHGVMCRALFPNGEKDEYQLRMQVIPLADEVMTVAFLNSI